MSVTTGNRRFGRVAAAILGAIGLAALAVPATPAHAQVYFGIGPFGVGIGPPAPYYYAPYPYYYPPYYYRW